MAGITVDIDTQGDVAYLTLGTGEPSYCEEVSDTVLIERGIYSKLITGLRILNYSKTRSGLIEFDRRDIRQLLIQEKLACQRFPRLGDRARKIEKLLETVDRKFVGKAT